MRGHLQFRSQKRERVLVTLLGGGTVSPQVHIGADGLQYRVVRDRECPVPILGHGVPGQSNVAISELEEAVDLLR